ncbi:NAD(P)-dependent oxidoreductase [Kiloniella laminariae]|uniref:NAD(P)-dependent oxidoreductase n=1 Tax=Kiloniella laminariae TaxID=454162 RepID=A0ABT4LMH4_9PROT|nr:NAD(P)-dependent oxidoreductase [Kiloniella laminariae]MCZ4282269.1 NAD(P)-dependent oxidoreductase [Kiloniella laminariae]
MKIGFVGLGSLGEPLAMNLVLAGHEVTVTDLNRKNAERLLSAGAIWSDDIAGICRSAETVITVLPSPEASRKVAEGEGGIFDSLPAGSTWIEMSTTDFEDLKRLSEKAKTRGIDVLECPVTGGVHRAHSGQITILVGGEESVFNRVRPVLQIIGGEIIYMGPIGHATVVKVVTNMLAFIHLVAASEGMMLARKFGVDMDAIWKAIRHSSGNSFVHETESKLILSGSYNVNFPIDLVLKDLGLAQGIAEKTGVPLELGSATQQIYRRAKGLFGGQAQSPEVARMIEQACGIDLRAEGYPVELTEENVG